MAQYLAVACALVAGVRGTYKCSVQYGTPCSFSRQEVCQWSNWEWGSCSTTCGSGVQSGHRTLMAAFSYNCRQPNPTAHRTCGGVLCPVHCAWGSWSPWECSATCGQGTRFRKRSRRQLAANGGLDCVGKSYEEGGECDSGCCPRDCKWSSWTWTNCSLEECDVITYRRGTRSVEVEACGGGKDCEGEEEKEEECPFIPCNNQSPGKEDPPNLTALWAILAGVLALVLLLLLLLCCLCWKRKQAWCLATSSVEDWEDKDVWITPKLVQEHNINQICETDGMDSRSSICEMIDKFSHNLLLRKTIACQDMTCESGLASRPSTFSHKYKVVVEQGSNQSGVGLATGGLASGGKSVGLFNGHGMDVGDMSTESKFTGGPARGGNDIGMMASRRSTSTGVQFFGSKSDGDLTYGGITGVGGMTERKNERSEIRHTANSYQHICNCEDLQLESNKLGALAHSAQNGALVGSNMTCGDASRCRVSALSQEWVSEARGGRNLGTSKSAFEGSQRLADLNYRNEERLRKLETNESNVQNITEHQFNSTSTTVTS